MDTDRKHIIDTFRVELTVRSPAGAHEMQDRVSTVIRRELKPLLEELFNEIGQSWHVVLDRLEVDLGNLSPGTLEEGLLSSIIDNIEVKLSDEAADLADTRGDTKSVMDTTEVYLSALAHYLKKGSYPWYISREMTGGALEEPEKLFERLLDTSYSRLRETILAVLPDRRARKRIAMQFGSSSLVSISKLVSSSLEPIVGQIFRILKILDSRYSGIMDGSRVRELVLETLSAYERGVESFGTAGELFETVMELASGKPRANYRSLLQRMADQVDSGYALESGLEQSELGSLILEDVHIYRLKRFVQKMESDERIFRLDKGRLAGREGWIQDLLRLADNTGLEDAIRDLLDHLGRMEEEGDGLRVVMDPGFIPRMQDLLQLNMEFESRPRLPTAFEAEPARQEVKGAGYGKEEGERPEYFIANAGLVLPWPFMTRFFRNLELIVDQEFIDEVSRYRAVHLLQYLAAGTEDTHEYLMTLNKLLCGLELEEPIPSAVEISGNEKEEVAEVIQSTIDHWGPLKSTSVEGLRESFIMRDGRLRRQEQYWLLKVESKAFDVLLDRLPWSINVVKLPWMSEPLHVEWR